METWKKKQVKAEWMLVLHYKINANAALCPLDAEKGNCLLTFLTYQLYNVIICQCWVYSLFQRPHMAKEKSINTALKSPETIFNFILFRLFPSHFLALQACHNTKFWWMLSNEYSYLQTQGRKVACAMQNTKYENFALTFVITQMKTNRNVTLLKSMSIHSICLESNGIVYAAFNKHHFPKDHHGLNVTDLTDWGQVSGRPYNHAKKGRVDRNGQTWLIYFRQRRSQLKSWKQRGWNSLKI